MESLNSIRNNTLQLKNRFRHITCVSVQIYKLEGNNWREMTKDFVLLHMYYDEEDRETKLVAIDGIKLIVRGFVLSSNLQLVRPTKKFVHFISSKQGKSEMYGFGFYRVLEVEQFLRLFSVVHKRLHLSTGSITQSGSEYNKRDLSISSTKSQPAYPISPSTPSTPNKDTQTVPPSSLIDSPWREPLSQEDVDVQHVKEGLQGLSFASDPSVTAPSFNLVPSLSKTSVDARSDSHCGDSVALESNSDATPHVGYKQYQLWSTPPWNALLEQPIYSNEAAIAYTWNSLLNN
ncbi:hypothetical protein ACH3XW_1930 [Acanthocheilonema viteae]